MSLLKVVDLRKSYGDHVAVNGLSFEIEAGEVFGLLGPNGAGKSTTMTMIAGLKRSDSGSITLDGHSMATDFDKVKNLLGLVPQDLAIYPDLTARENLNFFGRLYGIGRRTLRERIDQVLDQVGLAQNANGFARTFSRQPLHGGSRSHLPAGGNRRPWQVAHLRDNRRPAQHQPGRSAAQGSGRPGAPRAAPRGPG
ncbi:MAG: ABC transporter ATP-binding protein [Planctomycetia bacterium]|nr:ABC transporter ATP-binding protein [Planctomycetia bacterium]